MTVRALLFVFAAALSTLGGAAAQEVTWERLPFIEGETLQIAAGVLFLPGPEADTILQYRSGVFRYDEADSSWTDICFNVCGPRTGVVTAKETILIGAPAGSGSTISRSTDRGGTWDRDMHPGYRTGALFQSSLPTLRGPDGHGAIVSGFGPTVSLSFDDGARGSWAEVGRAGGEVVAFADVPPSAALPDGRLLAAVWNGVTVSDDGGKTWTPTTGAYGDGQFIGHSFAFRPEAGQPYGGAVLAGIDDLEWGRDSTATVYRSDDGGATWARVHRFSPAQFGVQNLNQVELVVTPDGVVWAGLTWLRGGLTQDREGAFARSLDGGLTWENVSAGYGKHSVEQLVVARDGRLYAATGVGVWRTTAPVYAVSTGAPSPEAGTLGLTVRPNPAGSHTEVVIRFGAGSIPTESVLTVTDAQGREVARLGGAVASERVWRLDTSGWASGVYVVRVSTDTEAATASFTVAR